MVLTCAVRCCVIAHAPSMTSVLRPYYCIVRVLLAFIVLTLRCENRADGSTCNYRSAHPDSQQVHAASYCYYTIHVAPLSLFAVGGGVGRPVRSVGCSRP